MLQRVHSEPHRRFIALFISFFVLSIAILSPLPIIQTVEGGDKPNSHAILDIRYSLTRYNIFPEWKEGVIELELYEKRAPITTTNFIMLAESGFYDGTMFHRVIDDFVIQGGDDNTKDNDSPINWWNDGEGGSDDTIPLEIHEELTHVDGAVGMAREFGNPDSATSQFYICDGPQHRLDDNEENNANRTGGDVDDRGYAVFAVTVQGIDIVREIASVWTTTDPNIPAPYRNISAHVHDHPIFDVLLRSVTIVHYDAEDDDDWITTEQIAGFGTLIFIGVGAMAFMYMKNGKFRSVDRAGESEITGPGIRVPKNTDPSRNTVTGTFFTKKNGIKKENVKAVAIGTEETQGKSEVFLPETIQCPKCGASIVSPTGSRPLKITCQDCGAMGILR